MCGIAGWLGRHGQPLDSSIVQRMTDSLVHRGPDAGGLQQPAPHVVLGHRRLAIIDVAGGQQPMNSSNGSVWVTFNGEIFNFRELREELSAKGHSFRTRSDTEVLVQLYQEEGPRCVERLNGQFAFAIFDGEKLFCARDPLGIKPFYYYTDADQFAFASEPRAFFALPGADLSPDLAALRLYLHYQFIPSPLSAYSKVQKLRPGETLTLTPAPAGRGEPRTQRYWDVTDGPFEDLDDPAVATEEIRERLSDAVQRQLISDFEVGAFLSGGIDSSSILAMAQRHSALPVRSFTIGFPEKDERKDAAEVASWVGSNQIDSEFDHQDAAQVMPGLLDHIDEPFGDTSLLPTYAVSRLARRYTPVALSGDGGDELFAGYGRYHRIMNGLGAGPLGRALFRFGQTPRSQIAPEEWTRLSAGNDPRWTRHIVDEIGDPRSTRLLGPALRDYSMDSVEDPVQREIERCGALPPLAQLLAIDLGTNLCDRFLTKVDRASMHTSLEVRVPFLDIELIRAALRLSPRVRLLENKPKGIVESVMRDSLPPSVFERKKTGFGPPVKYWFARDLAPYIEERLTSPLCVDQGLIARSALEATLKPRRSGKVSGPRVWRLLVLENWLRGLRDERFGKIPPPG